MREHRNAALTASHPSEAGNSWLISILPTSTSLNLSPQNLNSRSIPKMLRAEVLEVVRECKEGLYGYRAEAEVLVTQMGGLLDRLETAAIRAMKRKR